MEPITNHQPPRDGMQEVEPLLRPPLARLLREDGLVTYEQVDRALTEGERTGERLGEILLRRGLLDERQLAVLLARQWQLPFIDEGQARVDDTTPPVLSAEDARRIRAVPVRCQDGLVRVVVVEPTEERLAEVRSHWSQEVTFGVVARTSFECLLAALDEPPDAAEKNPQAPQQPADGAEDRGLDNLLALLDDETGHLEALRGTVRQFAAGVSEHERKVRQLESDVEAERNARAHDRLAIERLRKEAEERGRLLDVVRSKVDELAGALRAGRAD